MRVIGIDPGLSGAIAILEDNKVLQIFDMPVMAEGKKNKRQLNSAQLANIIKENTQGSEEKAVVVEQVSDKRHLCCFKSTYFFRETHKMEKTF